MRLWLILEHLCMFTGTLVFGVLVGSVCIARNSLSSTISFYTYPLFYLPFVVSVAIYTFGSSLIVNQKLQLSVYAHIAAALIALFFTALLFRIAHWALILSECFPGRFSEMLFDGFMYSFATVLAVGCVAVLTRIAPNEFTKAVTTSDK